VLAAGTAVAAGAFMAGTGQAGRLG
jgi:hypothetical protein